MSTYGGRPLTPAPSPRPGVPASPAPKWSSKPTPQPAAKTDFSRGGIGGTIRQQKGQMMREARAGKIIIPGTGGKRMTTKQVEDIFKGPSFSYRKVGTELNTSEKIRILRQMRSKDGGNLQSVQGRARREFEGRWGLKSGKDY